MVSIYVLKLEEGKWYIGQSSNVFTRLKYHFVGEGCEWTVKYPPIDVYEVLPEKTFQDEDNITKKFMFKFGIDNVRGGSYAGVKLQPEERKLLLKEKNTATNTCFRCGSSEHLSKKCPFKIKSNYDPNLKKCFEKVKKVKNCYEVEEICNKCGIQDFCSEKCVLNNLEGVNEPIQISDEDLEHFLNIFQVEAKAEESQDEIKDLIENCLKDIEKQFSFYINESKFEDVCLNCEEIGHIEEDCPYEFEIILEEGEPINCKILNKKRLR
jgi:predicted GIY-YIG superfamily endonuclease